MTRVQSVHMGQTSTGWVVKRISGATKKPYNIKTLDIKTTKSKSKAEEIAKSFKRKISKTKKHKKVHRRSVWDFGF